MKSVSISVSMSNKFHWNSIEIFLMYFLSYILVHSIINNTVVDALVVFKMSTFCNIHGIPKSLSFQKIEMYCIIEKNYSLEKIMLIT